MMHVRGGNACAGTAGGQVRREICSRCAPAVACSTSKPRRCKKDAWRGSAEPGIRRGTRCAAATGGDGDGAGPVDRRSAILISAGVALAGCALDAGVELPLTREGSQRGPRGSALAFSNPEPLGDGTKRVYGEATTAASYGGYGGSDKSDDRFKYTYEVPEEWRAETINKIEKGVTGIDNRQAASKGTKAYVITFPGYLKLKDDRDSIISDLAIADIQLQDILAEQESFESRSRMRGDQLFYDYDIAGYDKQMLATATVDGGRIYILVVLAPMNEYRKDEKKFQSIRDSLNTLSKGVNQADVEYFKRAT